MVAVTNRGATPNSEFVVRRPRVDDIVIFGETYMRRYHLINNRKFGIRLHHIRLPDYGRELHDHPFDFVSIVLKGWYIEKLMDAPQRVMHGFGRPHYRKAETSHVITDVSKNGVWTLVFRGPIRRRWGFWQSQNKKMKWVPHSQYEPKEGTS